MVDNSTTVESGSTPGTWAETRKSITATHTRAPAVGPSFVRRRSTTLSGSSRSAPERLKLLSARQLQLDLPTTNSSQQTVPLREAQAKAVARVTAGADQDREQASYYPSLGRIREEKERAKDAEDSLTHGHSRSQPRSRSRERASRRVVPSEDIGINSGHVYRRGVRHRSGQSVQLQKQLASIASASVLSVLSSLTTTSSASSGSNSTITQRKYDKSQKHRKKRRRSSQRDSEGEEPLRSRRPSTLGCRTYAVDDYMDEDGASGQPAACGASYASSHWQPQYRPHSSMGFQVSLSAQGSPRSAASSRANSVSRMDGTNSDSGISMRDTSPEAIEKLCKASPVMRHDSVLDVDAEGTGQGQEEQDDGDSSDEEETQPAIDVSQYQVNSYDEDKHLRKEIDDRQNEASSHILQSPQPRRYHSFARPRYDVQPGVQHMPYQDTQLPQAYAQRRTSTIGSQILTPHPTHGYQQRSILSLQAYTDEDPSQETAIGYELLAKKLAEHTAKNPELSPGKSFAPLYRRFDFLNHRVLLHLQDEIAELEEELRRTDQMIARHQGQYQTQQGGPNGDTLPQRIPTSRREEVSSGDELCERRSHILGRIYTRLEQYNKALASYRSATTGFAPATTDEIERYRLWMAQNRPVDEAESNFLNFKPDLMALRPQKTETQDPSAPVDVLPTVAERRVPQTLPVLAALTCIPMTLFALAPDIYSKAFVVVGAVAISALVPIHIPALLSLSADPCV